MGIIAFIVTLAVFGGSAVICHMLARRNGLQPVFWGVMGALFGPLAIIAVLLAAAYRARAASRV